MNRVIKLLLIPHYILVTFLTVADMFLYFLAYYYLRKKLSLLSFNLILVLFDLPSDLRRNLYRIYKDRTSASSLGGLAEILKDLSLH